MIFRENSASAPLDLKVDVYRAVQVHPAELTVVALATLVAFHGVMMGVDVSTFEIYLSSILLSAGLGVGIVLALRGNPAMSWTPLFWWRMTMLIYFGIGTLMPAFASEETALYVSSFFLAYPIDSIKFCLVSSMFSLILLLTTFLFVKFLSITRVRSTSHFAVYPCAVDAWSAGILLFVVGLPIKFLVSLYPLIVGALPPVPGVILALEPISTVGLAVLAGHFSRTGSKWVFLIVFFALIDGAIWVLQFNKSQALLPLIMVGLGMMMYAASPRRVFAIAGSILLLYVLITPLTNFGRAVDWRDGVRQAQLDRTLDIYSSYLSDTSQAVDTSNVNMGWARIAYFPAATFAISQYDQGLPGRSLALIPVALVPRVIWPDKPIVTGIANEFNEAATGQYASASSPGIPAEGYWNYGWTGVVLIALCMGAVFTYWSMYSIAVVSQGAWHLTFVALLGIRAGIRIDGFFGIDFVPSVIFAILGHMLFSGANLAMLRLRKERKERNAAVSA